MATSLESVTRVYGQGSSSVKALADVSLRVGDAEFVAVMGPSGSGKSTLLNVIGALDRPNRGRVVVDGQDIARLDARAAARYRRRSVGFIFQSFNLLPRLTVLENVALPLMFEGVGQRERIRRAAAVLTEIGMADRLGHRPPTLSGGEKQRAAIARALIANPDLLLADEPTGNLDSNTATTVMRLIADLNRSRGQTVLLITHDLQVASYARRVVRMRDGRVIDGESEKEGVHEAV
ncbi:MAG TPA: ABC transporter ATP-binding protein [Candidatus Dormibacteraeota bacterium]|nr:ABC transporter ATP-binding protein [Candidatus Dormibacteraeota bacterium]